MPEVSVQHRFSVTDRRFERIAAGQVKALIRNDNLQSDRRSDFQVGDLIVISGPWVQGARDKAGRFRPQFRATATVRITYVDPSAVDHRVVVHFELIEVDQ